MGFEVTSDGSEWVRRKVIERDYSSGFTFSTSALSLSEFDEQENKFLFFIKAGENSVSTIELISALHWSPFPPY